VGREKRVGAVISALTLKKTEKKSPGKEKKCAPAAKAGASFLRERISRGHSFFLWRKTGKKREEIRKPPAVSFHSKRKRRDGHVS